MVILMPMDPNKKTTVQSTRDYPFVHNEFSFYLKGLLRDRGLKALYQFMNRPLRRSHSRNLIKRFAPTGVGLEIGVGARTIAPVNRTILSDGHHSHGVDHSIAKAFFPAHAIPYPDGTFSFVLSEHVLEHIPNPIQALREWIRVLKPGGTILLFLPHKERTNDRFRSRTPLSHLIEDEARGVDALDPTHLAEWIELVVEKNLMPDHYKHVPQEKLLQLGCIHHHVWVTDDIIELFRYLSLEIVWSEDQVHDRRDTFVVVAKKP